jgi:alpha-acetolactate decarboxylase
MRRIALLNRRAIVSAVFLVTMTAVAAGGQTLPFHVHNYGSLQKMPETKNLDGVIGLKQALSAPHIYGVGEIKNAEGEITVYDGEVWLNYGEDGIDTSIGEIPRGEEAMHLITAEVEKWEDITIPKKMTDNELYLFVLEQARKLGITVKVPVPFLISGELKDVLWHVLQEADIGQDNKLFFTKLVEYRGTASALTVGFCSELRGDFTSPGEFWHVHVFFKNDKTAGHVDAFSVEKGATLRLPVK